MVIVAHLSRGDPFCFWPGILVTGVTFGAAKMASEICRETSDIFKRLE